MSEIGERIKEVVDQGLAPRLKSYGFKKSGKTFHRVKDDAVQVVNVQSSMSNQGSQGKFTVNISLYFPALERLWGTEVKPKPAEYHCHVRARMGKLTAPLMDNWWSIDPSVDLAVVAQEVAETLETFALPWLDRLSTHAGAAQDKTSHVLFFPMHQRAGLCALSGNLAGAKEAMLVAMRQSPRHRKSWRESAVRLNLEDAYVAAMGELGEPL